VGMSEIACERDDLHAATQLLLRSQELGEQAGLPQNRCTRHRLAFHPHLDRRFPRRLRVRVHDLSSCGRLGHWLWSHFTDPPDWVRIGGVWPLGDSPAVLVTALSTESSTATLVPPEASRHAPRHVYTDLDFRLIVGDMLARFRLHESQRLSDAEMSR
jgi:hypothetical protein